MADFTDDQGNAIISIIVHDSTTGQNTSVPISQEVIPDGYVKPTGHVTITENGPRDVYTIASVTVDVPQYSSGGSGGGTSSVQARAYHSITIGDKNTWDDWHLVPSQRPSFAMPQVKTSYIDLPGGDGVLDLTTSLTGRPMYGNRQGSFDFIVMNDYGNWYERYSDIATYLHGKEYQAILDDDPEYYYEGRFSVNQWKTGKNYSTLTINYNVAPYKRSILSAGEKWLWDPFSFETGVIYTYKNLVVTGETRVVYLGEVYESAPVFTCSKYKDNDFNMTVTVNERTRTLRLGTNIAENLQFNQGDNEVIFNGTGVISIENTGGRL